MATGRIHVNAAAGSKIPATPAAGSPYSRPKSAMVSAHQSACWADELLKHIHSAAGRGHVHPRDAFTDFLDVSLAAMAASKPLAEHLAAGGKPKDLVEAEPELWDRLRRRYGSDGIEQLCLGLSVLLRAAANGYADVLGLAYMRGEMGGHNGQFFTPASLAEMMAMTMDLPGQVKERVLEAASRSVVLRAMLFTYGLLGDALDVDADYFRPVFEAMASEVEPVKVIDPACGSGVMLLAAASTVPRWMVEFGLVRFSGVDVDEICVKMACLNLAVHGLGGEADRGNSLEADG